MENTGKVVVRYPPSPTGPFHVGNARTFLYNWLFAKQHGGKVVFRIEDTDKERSREEFAQDIIENLKWLKIEPDFSTTVKQSERGAVYRKYMEKMIGKGFAYISKEDAPEEGQRDEVVRFKNPNKKIIFEDLIRGQIEFDTAELKDFIIGKSLDEPIYHLAVVIDDFEMGVTHVIRGDDGISNTPRQILIQEAIGAQRPVYAHLPLILAPDKTKLSKRKHGEQVSVTFYRKRGYLPEALINFLSMIGWNPGTNQEIFSIEELVSTFSIEKVQKKGAIFNIEKLDWLNREWMRKLPKDEQMAGFIKELSETRFSNSDKLKDQRYIGLIFNLVLDRIHKWTDIGDLALKGEFDCFFEEPTLLKSSIHWKDSSPDVAAKNLKDLLSQASLLNDGEEEKFAEIMMTLAQERGKGDVLWPIRYALSGKEKSPDPASLVRILGISRSRERITKAIETLKT
jgi:glutamyl-tRNA synthetase